MEKWAKDRRRCDHQNSSSSSTLLDAISRSVDASSHAGGGRPDPASSVAGWAAAAVTRPFNLRRASPSSSSSDNTTSTAFGGFSLGGGHRARIGPLHTAARPLTPLRSSSSPPYHHRNRIKASPIRIKALEPGRPRASVSPGARLAGFLGSIFSMAMGKPRKAKTASSNVPCSMEAAAAADYSRPCLLKTSSSSSSSSRRQAVDQGEGLRRSVRFRLAENVVWGGKRSVEEGDERRAKEAKMKEKAKRRVEMRKMVEELLRGLEEEEEEEEEGRMSDASSDLFELENLTAVGGGGVYMDDELPVYRSTHLSTSTALSAILHL